MIPREGNNLMIIRFNHAFIRVNDLRGMYSSRGHLWAVHDVPPELWLPEETCESYTGRSVLTTSKYFVYTIIDKGHIMRYYLL